MKRLALLLLFGGVALGATRYIDTITTYVNDYITINRNELRLGDNTTGTDKKLTANNGEANEPYIFYDETANKWKKSDDGSIEKNFGEGGTLSGAYNNLDNAGFEDGITTNWTCSTGECTAETTDPLIGDRSVVFDAADQNDYIKSDLKAIPEGLKGTSCQARIGYTGGDDELDVRVLNGNGTTLVEDTLQAHDVFGYESLFFLCPSASEITGDSNKGDLQIEIYQTGTTNAASMTLDDMYLGQLIGLSETTLPDVLSAVMDNTGAIVSESSDFIDGDCTDNGVGDFTCSFISGIFSVAPSVNTTCNISSGSGDIAKTNNLTTSGFDLVIKDDSGSSQDCYVHIIASKQGSDAKQSVQVYKSIPKVAQNENVFSAYITNTGSATVVSENVDGWLTSATQISTGRVDIDYTAAGLTVTPVITANCPDSECDVTCISVTTTTSSCYTRSGGTLTDIDLNIDLHKQGADYKTPTVQPVIVGQVENSYASSNSKVMVHNACETNNNSGTPETNSDYCDSWISSITDSGTGDYTFNFVSGSFSKAPVCVCSTRGAGGLARVCLIQSASTSSVRTLIYDADDGVSSADEDVMLICTGEK